MGGYIGLWLDKLSGSENDIEAYQPEALVVGIGAWASIPRMFQLSPGLKFVSLRDTGKPLLRRNPEALADDQCNYMAGLIAAGVPKSILYAHGLDEEHTDRLRAIEWELRHIERVHERGYKVISFNAPFGNFNSDEAQDFRPVWDAADLVGPHSYLGHNFDTNQEEPRSETVYRPLSWANFPVHKWLATEGGYDLWAGTYSGPGNPGWIAAKLNEMFVAQTITAVANFLHAKGAAGYTWYCLRAQNEAEWSNYYPTRQMLAYWRQNAPKLQLPSSPPTMPPTPPPNPNGGSNMPSAKDLFAEIEKLGLQGHELIGPGKEGGVTHEEAGRKLGKSGDDAYRILGDIINKAREGAALPNL